MEGYMKENISKILKKAMDAFIGQMVEYGKDNGVMVKCMAKG